jgi:hypothetical protein
MAWVGRNCSGRHIRRHAAMVSLIADHGIHQMLRRQRGLTELLLDSDEVVAVSNLQTLWNTSWIGALPTHLHKRRTVAVASSEASSVGCNSGGRNGRAVHVFNQGCLLCVSFIPNG